MINPIVENLIDFYSEFKNENAFKQDSDFFTFLDNWPNCNINKIKKDYKSTINFRKKGYSKNWILSNEFYLTQKDAIKKAKLFPVNSWTNMDLYTTKKMDTKPINNFKISKLEVSNIEDFKRIINDSFKKELLTKEQILAMLKKDSFTCFVGKLNHKIVSTAVFFDNKKTIGLYFIATDKDYQKKGFASLTVKIGINHFIQKGKDHFILHATTMAKKMYENLNFIARDKMRIFVKI